MATTPNPIDLYAGSKVRLQRHARQMSQSDLANALGITFQQIQKYEKGMTRISASRLQAISRTLGVPISYFFSDDSAEPMKDDGVRLPDADIAQFLSSADGVKLNQAFVAIRDEKVRRSVVALVKTLATTDGTSDVEADLAFYQNSN